MPLRFPTGGGSSLTGPAGQTVVGSGAGAWTLTPTGGQLVSCSSEIRATGFGLSTASGYGLYTLGGPSMSLCTYGRNLTLVSGGRVLFA
ncbi:MAG: hypothetical protein RLZZ15_702, partial [Verrucomicrobiota bacterium]